MPVILSPSSAPPSGPGSQFPDVGFASATWIDPQGNRWPLTDTNPSRGYFTLSAGVSGLGAAPITLTTDDYPRGGVKVRHIQPDPRVVVWPIHVYGDSHTEFLGRWRQLARAFSNTKRYGPGWLEISRPDGSRRRISAYYQEGFEGLGSQGSGIISDSAVLSLYCPDPYWIDPDAVLIHREYAAAATSFFSPYPTVSSSQVLGDTTAVNPGDETAWPTWTITGPASAITATNNSTGESFVLTPTSALTSGQKVFITTDPPTVRYQDGSNWISKLSWPDAVLWGLLPGLNNVTFTLSGSNTGSAVDLSFNSRYETA